jgi:hypothetical protein
MLLGSMSIEGTCGMTARRIHRDYRTTTGSLLLETLGATLKEIKGADRATWADLGRVLGKHKDTVADYADGVGDMGIVSFLFGCREWDGRFANDVLSLVGMRLAPLDPEAACEDRTSLRALAELMAKKAAALEDSTVDDDELDGMWPEIEAVGRHIDRLRARRASRLRLLPNYAEDQAPPDTS